MIYQFARTNDRTTQRLIVVVTLLVILLYTRFFEQLVGWWFPLQQSRESAPELLALVPRSAARAAGTAPGGARSTANLCARRRPPDHEAERPHRSPEWVPAQALPDGRRWRKARLHLLAKSLWMNMPKNALAHDFVLYRDSDSKPPIILKTYNKTDYFGIWRCQTVRLQDNEVSHIRRCFGQPLKGLWTTVICAYNASGTTQIGKCIEPAEGVLNVSAELPL